MPCIMDRVMRHAALLAVFLFICAIQLSESESSNRERRDTDALANVKANSIRLSDENALKEEHHVVKRSPWCRRRRRRRWRRRRRRRRRVRIVVHHRPAPQTHVHTHHHTHNHHHHHHNSPALVLPPYNPHPPLIAQGCLRPCGYHAHCIHGTCVCNQHCTGDPYFGCHLMKK